MEMIRSLILDGDLNLHLLTRSILRSKMDISMLTTHSCEDSRKIY